MHLNLGGPWGVDITPWARRVLTIDAKYPGAWELRVLGQISAPEAVLIRPDGYIAWVGDGKTWWAPCRHVTSRLPDR
jgi:Aromatic-ring hydroxylase, C-terminal